MTLLPATASKMNMLGYYSICSFSPISTIMLGILGVLFAITGWRLVNSLQKTSIPQLPVHVAARADMD
jgi:hypothetical protein